MSHITNYTVLSQELIRAREIALPRFPEMENEIYSAYELANELITSLLAIDTLIEQTEFNQAIEMADRFISLAKRLFSLNPHIKRLFTSPDTLVSWRRSPNANIVHAIEDEARVYFSHFRSFLGCVLSLDDEDNLSSLRTQIRLRVAKDEITKSVASSSTWTPEAEKEARRLIQEGTVMTANALQETLSMNRTVAQGLYRHITGKKKRRYQTD